MRNQIQIYHDVLGLEFPATKAEIKKAFHKLAHVHHPDKGGDADMFKKINNAYQFLMQDGYWLVLADDKKKNPNKWKKQNAKKEKYTPQMFVSDDGLSFWIEDEDGFVVSHYGKLEDLEEVIYK